MKSTGSWYSVKTDGEIVQCRVRGKLRLEGFKETNPIAVGDFVDVESDEDGHVIVSILPRANHMPRQSVKKTGQQSVLAANLDQAALVVTITHPRTSTGFIDRFLATAEAYSIPQLLIFNKQDLLDEESRAIQDELIRIYTAIGIPSLRTSAFAAKPATLISHLSGKTTLVAGYSGVGKSTLLNQLAPHIHQKVGAISEYSAKGTHVTTFAEMFALEEGTFVIDTPGVKEWGMVNMSPEELSDHFPEMRALRSSCRFGYKCLHVHEPKCAVVEAVRNCTIALSRYESYLSILSGQDNRK